MRRKKNLNITIIFTDENGIQHKKTIENVVGDKIIHVKVGNNNYPARPEDMTNIFDAFGNLLDGNGKGILITHHAVEISTVDLKDVISSVEKSSVEEEKPRAKYLEL
jgi:hypothetical protein